MNKIAPQITKGALRIHAMRQGEEWQKVFYRTSIIVGRSNGTNQPDLDLDDDNTVSRSHARIWLEDGICWVEDLGSKFGTKVDAADIRGIGKVRINSDSRVHVGATALRIEPHVDVASGYAELPPQHALVSTIEIDKTLNSSSGRPTLPRSSALDAVQQQALLLEILVQFSLPAALDQLLQTITGRVLDLIPGARRATLLLRNPATDSLLLAAFVSPGEPAVSETLARRALKQKQAFIWRNSFGGASAMSIHRHQIQSGMYTPLIYDGQPLGVLGVDNPDCQSAFTDEDLQLLVAVGDHAAVAVSHHQSREELRRKSILLEAMLSHFSPSVRGQLLEAAQCIERDVAHNESDLKELKLKIGEVWENLPKRSG